MPPTAAFVSSPVEPAEIPVPEIVIFRVSLVTVFPAASCTAMTGWVVMTAASVVFGTASVVIRSRCAAPNVGVIVCVAAVNPPTVKVNVYEVPAVPEIPNPEKVAVPVAELIVAVVVPTNCPPRFTRTETVPPTPVTVALDTS